MWIAIAIAIAIANSEWMIDDLLWGLVGWWVVMIRKSARSTNPIGVVI